MFLKRKINRLVDEVLFIAGIYKFTIGAIINRPKKVCVIYAGEQCSHLQEKTFNRAVCEGFLL